MDTSLFQNNLDVVEKYQPELAKRLREIEATGSHLVVSDGLYNIDLGHVDFYDGGAEDFSDKQFVQFEETPQRVQLGWPVPLAENTWKAQAFRTELREHYVQQGIESAPAKLDNSAAFAVVLGLGLGFHINKIFTEYKVRSIYVAEQYLEFVYHALHVHDARDWYETAEKRNGRFIIMTGNDANQLSNNIFMNVKFSDFGLADGAYFYEHYDSFLFKQVAKLFLERIPIFAANPGFYEDEVIMMTNCFKNITSGKFWDFSDSVRFARETPVFVAGSGPSLDNSIDFIIENRDNIVLITAGSGLGTVLGFGVKPDFHVETENTPVPPKFPLASKLKTEACLCSGCSSIKPSAKYMDFFEW